MSASKNSSVGPKGATALSGDPALFEYLLRLGDDRLILGHRLSEWCGHGPILEEDLALGNIGLDLIGQGQAFLALAASVENQGRSDDLLAYFRDERQFRNAQLTELSKGDFAFTILRQFFFDCFAVLHTEQLQKATQSDLAALAAKSFKEHSYHARHSAQWVIRLGDGTAESHARISSALEELWSFTGEFFIPDDIDARMNSVYGTPLVESLKGQWSAQVRSILEEATLKVPADCWMHSGGRRGVHTENMGILLAEMQSLARAHPGASW